MEQRFVVDTTWPEVRIALLEDGKLVEIYTENEVVGEVGSFYRGRVVRVLPALQSAFVDVGLSRDGFLGWDDVLLTPAERKKQIKRIDEVIKEDSIILAQITKESRGSKGCRLTTRFSIPGRYLVLLPEMNKIMVSKKITQEAERKRLKSIVSSFQKAGVGFIIRTVSEGVAKSELNQDARYLLRIWERVQAEFKRGGRRPHLLFEELGIIQRVLRDKWTKSCKEILVDSPEIRNQVLDSLSLMAPRTQLRKVVRIYEGSGSVFSSLGLDEALQAALSRVVRLPSGGSLIIDEIESLTVIDVNSGRLTGGQSPTDIALQTNLEAAEAIAYHLRLRNVGGIVVIDFINIESKREQEKILKHFRKSTKIDRAVTDIYDFSDLGIVQLCRERTRESISKLFTVECPSCQGSGRLPKHKTL